MMNTMAKKKNNTPGMNIAKRVCQEKCVSIFLPIMIFCELHSSERSELCNFTQPKCSYFSIRALIPSSIIS